MMGSPRVHHQIKNFLIVIVVTIALIVVLDFIMRYPMNYRTRIILVWLLIIPLSYRILAERDSTSLTFLQLPGVPAGSSWQPRSPRSRPPADIPGREQTARELKQALRKMGYSPDTTKGSDVDLLARSPDGESLVVKICEGQAGVLACQDTMRAMLDKGAREAIVIAPHGLTSAAKRFVRKIRSRKSLRIRTWNNPKCAEAGMKK